MKGNESMSKLAKRIAISLVFVFILTLGISSTVLATTNYYDNVGNPENSGRGPAPNFGDGVSDGPGW